MREIASLMPRFHGLGTPQPMQHARFRHFHAARVAGAMMVLARQVQHAMHDQMRQMVLQGAGPGHGLPPHRAKRQDDFPWARSGGS